VSFFPGYISKIKNFICGHLKEILLASSLLLMEGVFSVRHVLYMCLIQISCYPIEGH